MNYRRKEVFVRFLCVGLLPERLAWLASFSRGLQGTKSTMQVYEMIRIYGRRGEFHLALGELSQMRSDFPSSINKLIPIELCHDFFLALPKDRTNLKLPA